ncbi:MAG: polyphosphate polymerase domain-containing protein [Prolixibacteraceae bacterium]|jgi:hypothetical protein|nr:polyphosphate polymerase domain-containing protein [Prolixibacteraceae bacterium]
MNLENKIKDLVSQFDPIKLNQMDRVALMRRTDTKFVFNIEYLPQLLERALSNYFMVEIKDEREQLYETTYFDTNEYSMYNLHHNGKLNRQKVRLRKYIYSKQGFLEIKHKNNKGETIKKRVQHYNESISNNNETENLIEQYTPYNTDLLTPTLDNKFIRLTLVNKDYSERITIDYKLQFYDRKHNLNTQNDNICIAEIKKERENRTSPFIAYLKELGINSMGFSKYCMGMALLNPDVKNNRFKERIRSISKIN